MDDVRSICERAISEIGEEEKEWSGGGSGVDVRRTRWDGKKRRDGVGREGKGREGKGREGKGREGWCGIEIGMNGHLFFWAVQERCRRG